jgi:hypothetical protein
VEPLVVVSVRIGTSRPESHDWVVTRAPIAPDRIGIAGEPISKRVPVPGNVRTSNYALFSVEVDDSAPLNVAVDAAATLLRTLHHAYGDTRPDDFELVLWISMDNNRKAVWFAPDLIDILARLGGAVQLLVED